MEGQNLRYYKVEDTILTCQSQGSQKIRKPMLKLKALRVECQITQATIAKELGISKSSYAKKENGVDDFGQYECYKLLKFFGEECGKALF